MIYFYLRIKSLRGEKPSVRGQAGTAITNSQQVESLPETIGEVLKERKPKDSAS
jgi:hypothetical protein